MSAARHARRTDFATHAARVRAVDKEVLRTLAPVEEEEAAPLDEDTCALLTSKFPLLDANGVAFAICGM